MNAENNAACVRCGAFGTLLNLSGRQLCDGCVARYAQQAYWPPGYLMGVGALMNPAIAATLMALNHQRLEDRKQARNWWLLAAGLVAFYVVVIVFDVPVLARVILPAGIGAAVSIGRLWQPPWELLKQRGAKRANWWLPLIVSLAVLFSAAIAFALSMAEY